MKILMFFVNFWLNQIQNCSVQIKKMKDGIFTFQLKRNYFCQALRDNAWHKNVPSPLDLTRTWSHTIKQGFHPISLAKFLDFSWLFGTQVPWLSLTLTRNELEGSHIFPKSKFKEFQGDLRKKFAYFQEHFTHDVWLS